jgi:hypothetical protein
MLSRTSEASSYAAHSDLVPLAQLVAEGLGFDAPYVRTARDAIDALARQLGDRVVVDDIPRRCVTRDTARELLVERDADEQRKKRAQQRQQAAADAYAEKHRTRPRGVPVYNPLVAAAGVVVDARG